MECIKDHTQSIICQQNVKYFDANKFTKKKILRSPVFLASTSLPSNTNAPILSMDMEIVNKFLPVRLPLSFIYLSIFNWKF